MENKQDSIIKMNGVHDECYIVLYKSAPHLIRKSDGRRWPLMKFKGDMRKPLGVVLVNNMKWKVNWNADIVMLMGSK